MYFGTLICIIGLYYLFRDCILYSGTVIYTLDCMWQLCEGRELACIPSIPAKVLSRSKESLPGKL